MKITETIERNCCDQHKGDLLRYKGVKENCSENTKFFFCKHCGQIWMEYHDHQGDCSALAKVYLNVHI